MRFERSIEIAAAPARVWAVWTDVERWPEWTASVTSVERLEGGDLAVGKRVRIRQPRFPPATWTLTALEAGRSFTWRSGSLLVRAVAEHSVAPAAGGAVATMSLRMGGLLGGLLGWLTRRLTERYLDLEARGLKERSEGDDRVAG